MGTEKQLINKWERERRRRNTSTGSKKESSTAAGLQRPSGFRCSHRIIVVITWRKKENLFS